MCGISAEMLDQLKVMKGNVQLLVKSMQEII